MLVVLMSLPCRVVVVVTLSVLLLVWTSSIQSVHGNNNNLPDCGPEEEYGVTPCVAASEFQVVPDQYKNLPLLDLQTKWGTYYY